MHRTIGMVSAVLGFSGVALGAFGAHALKAFVHELPDAADRLAWWDTASRYHVLHALAVGLVAVVARQVTTRAPRVAAVLFVAGVLIFSGSLYAMALTGVRALGALTPLGGAAQLAGWLALGVCWKATP